MRLTSLLALLISPLVAQQASFEGVATHALTHEPLSGVQVHLVALRGARPGYALNSFGAVTDRAGHFSINPLPPGPYLLMPQLRGFIYGQRRQANASPTASILLKPGQNLNDFTLEMMPRAVITGRVLDEFGEPLRFVEIEAESASKEVAVGALTGDGKLRGQTDDRGVFRLSGYPGKYYIKATKRDYDGGPVEIRTDGSAVSAYSPTYFPAAPTRDGAATVEPGPGIDVTGVEIRLIHAGSPQSFGLSGTVMGLSDKDERCQVILQSGEKPGQYNSMNTVACNRDGKFSVRGLEPGYYRVVAEASSGSSAPLELRLDRGDATDVVLTIAPFTEVSGKVEFSDGAKPKGVVRLSAPMRLTARAISGGEIGVDGSFRITGVPVGEFTVTVEPLPSNAYMKSLRISDAALLPGRNLNIEPTGISGLKILVSLNAAQVSGVLRGADGGIVTNGFNLVFLIDDIEKIALLKRASERMARVDIDGKFRFTAVGPGKYRLVAVDSFRTGIFDDDDLLKKLAAKAEEFEVKEGDRATREIGIAFGEAVSDKAK